VLSKNGDLPKELRNFGLAHPKRPVRRRLIMTTEAETGAGKSTLSFRGAPKPLLHFNLDNNIEPWEEQYAERRDIFIKHVEMPVDHDQKECMELYRNLKALYKAAAMSGYFRTIHIDTGEKLWELIRWAYLGTVGFGEVPQASYMVPNANMRMYFDLAKQERMNLIISHHIKEEVKYKGRAKRGEEPDKEFTGKRVAEGWKHTKEMAQIHLVLAKDPAWNNGDGLWDTSDVANRYIATVAKCNARPDLEGHVFRGEEICFPAIGTMIYPASNWEEWE